MENFEPYVSEYVILVSINRPSDRSEIEKSQTLGGPVYNPGDDFFFFCD